MEGWSPLDKRPESAISFRFGSRSINAVGSAADHAHPNVFRLQIQRTLLDRVIQAALPFLPFVFASWIQSRFPEWFLPENIVFKIQKTGWEEEFDREIAIYEQLGPVQGITIPRHYGTIEYGDTRAIILSDIGGYCLSTPEGAVLGEEDLHSLLQEALSSLTKLGFSHEDTKLDNFHLVTYEGKDKIMVVDMEIVDTGLSEDTLEFAVKSKSNWLKRQYRNHLECLEFDGVLLPKRPIKA